MSEIKTVIDRQEARLREMQTWLAILVARHGIRNDHGWRYELTVEEATLLRQLMPREDPQVAITVDYDGVFTLDLV